MTNPGLITIMKLLIHQANEKMDRAILKNLFMFDLLQHGRLNNHKLHSGDIAVFASVGAGMNVNSMGYRMP